jgi:hypothetical protein
MSTANDLKIHGHLETLREKLTTFPTVAPFCLWIETKTRIRIEYAVCGVVALLALFVMVGFADSLITNIILLVYPIILTLRCLEDAQTAPVPQRSPPRSPGTPGSLPVASLALTRDQWLMYWMLLTICLCVENSLKSSLIYFVPLYFPLKLTFFVSAFSSGRLMQFCLESVIPPPVDYTAEQNGQPLSPN